MAQKQDCHCDPEIYSEETIPLNQAVQKENIYMAAAGFSLQESEKKCNLKITATKTFGLFGQA